MQIPHHLSLLAIFLHQFALSKQQQRPTHDKFESQRRDQPNTLPQNYCRIPTKELETAVDYVVSRVLLGECSPRAVDTRFSVMESKIKDHLDLLRAMIADVVNKLHDQDVKIKSQHNKLHREMDSLKSRDRHPVTSSEVSLTAGGALAMSRTSEDAVYDYYDDRPNYQKRFPEVKPSLRDPEIVKYNSSVHVENGKRIFSYYWRVGDLAYRMKNWGWRRSLRSDSFYINQYGYKMYMRIYPNQNGKNIYIHVGVTHGDYDSALKWPFRLKHKLQVLDHEQPGEDLSSRIWDPTQLCSEWNWRKPDLVWDNYECVGLGFPHETLRAGHYLHNDSITIKLTVLLD